MATIKFFTRTITKNKNQLVPIYVRVRYGKEIDLCCKADILVKPDNWSNDTQQARQRADIFKFKAGETDTTGRADFNKNIEGLKSAIYSELTRIHKDDVTAEWLKTFIDRHWHPEKYQVNLFSYIRSFIDKSETKPNPKTGRPVSYKMRREYEVSFNYLKAYAEKIGKKIDFKDIDLNFYDGFVQFLQDEKLAVNTIGKKVQTLKIFLNAAKDDGLNNYDKFKSKKFVSLSEEAETIYLNESELEKLYKKDFSKNPNFDRIRDLFLVGCWTGVRFSDLSQITPENISDGFIRIKQHKTEKGVVIPLHPVVTAILNKYGGELPEVPTNQYFNRTLKDVARLAEINGLVHVGITKGGQKVSKAYKKHELVTTHTARRSFATNLYQSDFPTLSIMAITGHKTEQAFLTYIKVTPDEHAKKLQVHWNKRHLKVVS